MPGAYALVLAAGRGTRLGGPVPKQYRLLAGRPVLRHGLEALSRVRGLAGIAAVIHPDDRPLYATAAAGLDLLPPLEGGAERQDSALAGLEALAPLRPDAVLIHDGARPLLPAALAERVLSALVEADGALAALPLRDTVKRAAEGTRVAATVDRSGLWRAQTPQAFRFEPFLAAHRRLRGAALGDDAAVAERAGLAVTLVMGAEENLKITTEDDLALAEQLMAARCADIRTGFGFDVHRFGPGDHVMLCGIRIPHGKGLIGHSDADVGLHALTDAVLGAIGAGDIGQHFPPADPRWRGAESGQFLSHAVRLASAQGGRLHHIDVTIICEAPRIGPYRAAMAERIARLAGLELGRVSVKATTTEGLGFTGRGEGIAAQAVATVGLPA